MTTADDASLVQAEVAGEASRWTVRWRSLEALLERLSERLNPILVKESRQALKSRQFTITFWLLLVCGAVWSFLGVAILMPRVYYVPSGKFMLIGYYFILAVPLLIVVPFSAFRSLAAECEDGTYELLSITALTSRQIVTGKLGSALLQMLVYYAALAPCIAFTYLLRGIDIITITLILFYTFLVSLLLSTLALVFAGLSRSRHWQALVSVVLLLALLAAGWGWSAVVVISLFEGDRMLNEPVFWLLQLCVLTMYVTYFLLFVFAAAAQNSFASDNRSSKLRIVMLVQLVLFSGWMSFFWIKMPDSQTPFVFLIAAAIQWMLYGAMMTGEVAELSPRARRDLPHSFLGRMFLTWFNPGSATGYVFAVTSFLALVLVVVGTAVVADAVAPRRFALELDRLIPFACLLWGYMACYLALGRFAILSMRRFASFGGLFVPVIVNALLLASGAAVPTFLQLWLEGFNGFTYSALQVTNWAFTLGYCVDRGIQSHLEVAVMVMAAAAIMWLANLALAFRDVEHVRQETPERVLADEANSLTG